MKCGELISVVKWFSDCSHHRTTRR